MYSLPEQTQTRCWSRTHLDYKWAYNYESKVPEIILRKYPVFDLGTIHTLASKDPLEDPSTLDCQRTKEGTIVIANRTREQLHHYWERCRHYYQQSVGEQSLLHHV